MEETNLLEDMNSYFDNKGEEQNENRQEKVLRSTTNRGSANKNVELLYTKLEDMGINLDELKPFLECETNILCLSGAGAGKTTALILKVIRGILSGDLLKTQTVNSVYGQTHIQVPANILVSTFLKTGAQDLQRAMRDWCQKLNIQGLDYTNISFRTIHSEVKDALTAMGVSTPIMTDSDKIVRSLMKKYSIRSANAKSRNISFEEVQDVSSILAFARNRLDKKRYEHSLMGEYAIDSLMLDALLVDYKNFRRGLEKLDFEDMQEMLLEAMQQNPNVVKYITSRYDYVYVDEFQDTSQLQYELLKYYFKGARQVIAIGDSDQSIYSWRGSDIEIITHKFEADFKPTVLKLTTNYRCSTNILKPVIPSIVKNGSPHSKDLRAHKVGGVVNVVSNGDVNHLFDSIQEDIGNKSTVGVLARVNSDLLIPAILLELNNTIDFTLSKSVNMNTNLCLQVFGMVDLVSKRYTPNFETLFKVFLKRYYWYEAEKLSNVLKANKDLSIYTMKRSDLQHSAPNLYPYINGLLQAKKVGDLEAYIYLLEASRGMYKGNSAYEEKARDMIDFVINLILNHEQVKDLSFHQIDQLFNDVLPDRLTRRCNYSGEAQVKLTTVHEAKGKEWDSVYIWNNIEGRFPNKVGNRELTEEEFEEERRVHYIAWTRAKTKLTVFTNDRKRGVFLEECDLSLATDISQPEKDNSQPSKKKVFKGNKSEDIDAKYIDQLLSSYISSVEESGSFNDSKKMDIDITLNYYTRAEVLYNLKSKYGQHLMLNEGDAYVIIEEYFSETSDEAMSFLTTDR